MPTTSTTTMMQSIRSFASYKRANVAKFAVANSRASFRFASAHALGPPEQMNVSRQKATGRLQTRARARSSGDGVLRLFAGAAEDRGSNLCSSFTCAHFELAGKIAPASERVLLQRFSKLAVTASARTDERATASTSDAHTRARANKRFAPSNICVALPLDAQHSRARAHAPMCAQS